MRGIRIIMDFRVLLTFLLLAVIWPADSSLSFSFSEYEHQEAAGESSSRHVSLASLRCPPSLKKARIATMIGEMHKDGRGYNGFYGSFLSPDAQDWDRRSGTSKSVYGRLVDELNQGFKQLGLRTYTSEEINAQVAREEQEAFLNNNLDAAISAAERLRAEFMLKGIISTRTQVNRVVNVDEVFVTINLSLFDRNGRQISQAMASETSFSDADVLATIQKIVQKQSNEITYELFREYCRGGN
ncbi:MAG: hypothetical protein A2X81_13915 [Desulfobacterales bacterium GWB2_56_26]|nr:MAG: hypothetical protein A2X81_13915 [Desulfobacterales bacterium GWB2_56_26]